MKQCPKCNIFIDDEDTKCDFCGCNSFNVVNKPKNNINTIHLSENISIPKCPTCSSTNIQKISLTKKAVGGAMFGIFSNSVRKTFECNNCSYKW